MYAWETLLWEELEKTQAIVLGKFLKTLSSFYYCTAYYLNYQSISPTY